MGCKMTVPVPDTRSEAALHVYAALKTVAIGAPDGVPALTYEEWFLEQERPQCKLLEALMHGRVAAR
eukprot:9266175-Lingulodinium_polyedra.AAC.1